ncbi:MAG: hypothetical protein J6N21_03605, partial [Butyrivibrio sp.]|nr:hypothetical protein [Butyrivibrio sp.]
VKKDSTFSIAKPGVKIASAYGAKGLEFDVVIIPMFAEGNFPYGFQPDDEEAYEQYMIKMRNLVYVSMTRARFKLVITFWGNKGSRFIADMDPALYNLTGDMPNIKVPSFVPKAASGPVTESSTPSMGNNSTVKPVRPVARIAESIQSVPTSNVTRAVSTTASKEDLVSFLKSKGVEAIDKRDKGGALWIIGDKSLDPIVQETKKLFGAMWIYKAEGGMATKHRPSWYTKSSK